MLEAHDEGPDEGADDVLPEAARFAWWATAWLRGRAGVDHVLAGITGGDTLHVVARADDADSPADSLLDGLLDLRSAGAASAGLALPVEGDLLGLGGPASFNLAATEVGQAVVAGPVGLVPARTGPTVVWHLHDAGRRQPPDVGEADRALRQELIDAARALADLDVARWRPEAADVLMNLRHVPDLDPPPGTPPRCVDLAGRASRALDVVRLALDDDGGAVSADEARRRRDALVPLEAAGRRALVAACSPDAWPPA